MHISPQVRHAMECADPNDRTPRLHQEYLQGTTSMRVLCACYEISRRVGHKWLTRFLVEGDTALRELGRR